MSVGAAELAQIQADLAAVVCDKTCLIYAKTGVSTDASGNPAPTYSGTAVSTMAGLQQPNATLLANYAYKIGSLNSWHVLFPIATDVKEEYLLEIEGLTLTVHVELDPHSYPGLKPVLAAAMK